MSKTITKTWFYSYLEQTWLEWDVGSCDYSDDLRQLGRIVKQQLTKPTSPPTLSEINLTLEGWL